jgi:predicted ATPase
VQLIVRHLAGRSLVVVLDNCEHVIAEAAALADTLAGAVPGLRLIATSREALGIPGEVLVPVGGLAIPAAMELFADRARAVQPGFLADGPAGDVIEDICRRLDGLPLAVELAAARLRALPLATVAERLDDRFRLLTGGARTALPRQQTPVGVTGTYFADSKPRASSPASRDTATAARLWQISLDLVARTA